MTDPMWTLVSLERVASRYTYIRDFRKHHPGGYVRAGELSIKMEDLGLIPFPASKRAARKWTVAALREVSEGCITKGDFIRKNENAYRSAKDRGLLEELGFPEECRKAPNAKWDKETARKEAAKYAKRGHFQKGCQSAYQRAYREGWLDEFFPK